MHRAALVIDAALTVRELRQDLDWYWELAFTSNVTPQELAEKTARTLEELAARFGAVPMLADGCRFVAATARSERASDRHAGLRAALAFLGDTMRVAALADRCLDCASAAVHGDCTADRREPSEVCRELEVELEPLLGI